MSKIGAKIDVEFFSYSDKEWNTIKDVVRRAVGKDADNIKRTVTKVISGDSITGVQTLRDRIENAASIHLFKSQLNRQMPAHKARDQLIAIDTDAENLRASILNSLSSQVGVKSLATPPNRLILSGVDHDMVGATNAYFDKLRRNLHRLFEVVDEPKANARRIGREQFWENILAIWREMGGKAEGVDAADFLIEASVPVFHAMPSGLKDAVPGRPSVVAWLSRLAKRRS